MAASASTSTPIRMQLERFSTKPHDCQLLYLSLNLSEEIAVSGCYEDGRTFIDLYIREISDSMNKLKLFSSTEFEKYSKYSWRFVSFLGNNSKLVTCIGDRIEIIDTKQESKLLRSCTVKGETITCLAVREEEIFLGLHKSMTVTVLDNDLTKKKKIILRGIQDGDWPYDLQVTKDRVFVCSGYYKVYSISEGDGSNVRQYTDTTGKYTDALSVTVSETLGIVAVLWSYPVKGIFVYSLVGEKCFLVFPVDHDAMRIRISYKDRMMVTANQWTGEINMYDLEKLFSFEAMKRTLANIVSPDECEKLRKYFRVTEEELKNTGVDEEVKWDEICEKDEAVGRMGSLLSIVEEKGHLNPYNIKNLKDAVSTLGDESHISSLQGPIEGYVLHGLCEVKVADMISRQEIWDDDRNKLSSKLKTAESRVTEHKKTVDDLRSELRQVKIQSAEIEEGRAKLADQLEKSKLYLDSNAAEIKSLKEELAHARTKSTNEIETVSDQLKLTEQTFDTCKPDSSKEIEPLKEQLEDINRLLDSSRTQIATLTDEIVRIKTESDKDIDTLKKELEQTKIKSAKEIETLTKELEQTKQSLDSSRLEPTRDIEILTEELEHTRTKSAKEIETLTKELEHTKVLLDATRIESTTNIETLKEELEQTKKRSANEIDTSSEDVTQRKQGNTVSDRQIETITGELIDTNQKLITRTKELETANRNLEVTKQVLKETIRDRDGTRTKLKQSQLDFAKESKALKDVLNQRNEAMAELWKRSVEDKPSVDSETRDESNASLTAEFGRLTVAIAEHLTLDDCLKMARICNIPVSDCDTLLRLSLIESPGIKFLDLLKERNIINMFDVTNVQKGLAMLHQDVVNHKLVLPYQRKIDEERFEQHKLQEICSWEDVEEVLKPVKGRDTHTSEADATAEHEENRRPISRGKHQDHWYIEQSISREGGTIQLANISLTVPPDALQQSHVIALSVMNESPFPLHREIDTARMTPIIKLEPLGLMFKKSLQLTIPHSALIPEPENHDVIIYLGQTSKSVNEDSSDCIKWTEERSIPRQLKEKSLTIGIQYLSYLSASLRSQTTAPSLDIIRVVPFIDGVRNSNDDITLTVCFCNDNDAEYNMLLSDYKIKLPLEKYSTLQLHRHSENDDNDAGYLSVTVKSANSTYVSDAEQAVKKFAVSHLCTASRVSHQVKMKKNLQDTDWDVVDIELTFSQAQYGATKISLKARIKDLIISEESEKFLSGSLPPETAEKSSLISQLWLKEGQRTVPSSPSDQSVQSTFFSSCVSSDVNVQTLISEGYIEHDAVEALDISRNSLVMARKVLQFVGEQLNEPPKRDYKFLHKEQYIDENGGEITLREANVHVMIPVGTLSKGRIVSLTMMTCKQGIVPSEGRSPQLSPVIKLGPEGSSLNKPVTLRIPHCASITEGITSTDTYLGFSSNGEEIQWRKRKEQELKPALAKDHFEVPVQQFCAISMDIAADFGKPCSKRFRVLPLMCRIQNPTDDLTVILWIYNDDETEHLNLQHEEINVGGKIPLHNFKEFILKGFEREKEVHIKSGSSKITPHANLDWIKIPSTTLWHNTRHAVEFRYQNKDGIADISFRLRLCTRQFLGLRTVTDLQFDFKVTLSELLQEPQVSNSTLLQNQEPHPAMEKSFQELVNKVSGELVADYCLEIARIFRLSSDFMNEVKESSEPGKVLFDKLLHEKLITAASVSALDVALTRTGEEDLAEYVRIYRQRNAAFPTTTFTLL